MKVSGFVSPHLSSSYVSPHFDGANKQLKDFSNITGDPFSLDGEWKSSQAGVNNFTIKDNYIMNYGGIPPRHIDFKGGNRISFNFGYSPAPIADVIGGDTIQWSTGEKWDKVGAVPSGTPSPTGEPSKGKTNWLLWGGIGLAVVAGAILFIRSRKNV